MEPGTPDVDALVAQLRARVAERRHQGDYPPELEHDLADQARLLLHRRVHAPRPVDLAGPLARIDESLPLSPDRFPAEAGGAMGSLQRLVAGLVEGQTQAIVDQIQGFAGSVAESLAALAAGVEQLAAEVETLRPPVRAVIERQAVEEIVSTRAAARP
ncbi:MAG: hypothetical protein ACRDZ7_10160 [Acidimicrobiia bacterium]